mmetsp:Transcript_81172/g.229967  ORF Transcript_81172/g.229967 Transcript_81172/m.229967 type:complete len:235 (+) Transcript_81172:728-1432(+)
MVSSPTSTRASRGRSAAPRATRGRPGGASRAAPVSSRRCRGWTGRRGSGATCAGRGRPSPSSRGSPTAPSGRGPPARRGGGPPGSSAPSTWSRARRARSPPSARRAGCSSTTGRRGGGRRRAGGRSCTAACRTRCRPSQTSAWAGRSPRPRGRSPSWTESRRTSWRRGGVPPSWPSAPSGRGTCPGSPRAGRCCCSWPSSRACRHGRCSCWTCCAGTASWRPSPGTCWPATCRS